MPQVCKVCSHPAKTEIEVSIVGGNPLRQIGRRYGLTVSSIMRHRDNHLPESLVRSKALQDLTDADRLAVEIANVKRDVHRLLEKAEAAKDYRAALLATNRALKAIELQARVMQLIQDAPQVNIRVSNEWIEIRTAIVDALLPYPDARGAVLRALEGMDVA